MYQEGWVDVSMPGYVDKVLTKFQHNPPKRPQYSPYPAPEPTFGLKAQELSPADDSPPLGKDGEKFVCGVT